MTTVAIHQPNYAPWLGYFRKIAQSDIFVFYDNVQMPMGKSLVTRNCFKSPQGSKWLTVPTEKSGSPCLIRDARIVPGNWSNKHIASLNHWYAGSEWLEPICQLLENTYDDTSVSVSDLNIAIIQETCRLAGLTQTSFIRASEMAHGVIGAESITPILEELGATDYLTGQGAGSTRHLDIDDLSARGIRTRFLSSAFDRYPQRHGNFEENLSALDALLNVGPTAFRDLLNA